MYLFTEDIVGQRTYVQLDVQVFYRARCGRKDVTIVNKDKCAIRYYINYVTLHVIV